MARHIVITPPRRFALPKLDQLWEAREVLYRFGARDVTLRYRQTALGVAWVVLQPLLTAGILTVVFGSVAKLSSEGVPYFVFTFVGMLAWNLFNGIITRASGSLVANVSLVSKVFFPRMLVPLAVVYSALVDFAVALGFLVVLLVIFGIAPGWGLALAPVWIVMVILLASAVGLVSSGLMVRYRDVAYIVPFILQFLFFASPIAYSTAAVPAKYQFLYNVNPLAWLLHDFQWSFLNTSSPPIWQLAASVALPIALFLAGALIFEQMERGFADVI